MEVVFAGLLLCALPLTVAAASTPTGTSTPAAASADPTAAPSGSPPASSTTPAGSPTPAPPASSASPNPSPSSSPAAPVTTSPAPAPNPNPTGPDQATQQLIDQARATISGTVADALSQAQRLSDLLTQNTSETDQLQQLIDSSQAKIDSLNQQITQLDDQISDTQQKIDDERGQIAVMARQLYQEPDSLLVRLLRAGSVRDMVTQTSDLTVAALHANSLEQQLQQDLSHLNDQVTRRNADLDQENQLQTLLSSSMSQLQDLANQAQSDSDQLQSVISDGQSALAGSNTEDAILAQQVAADLQQREQQMIATVEQDVWQQEQIWATVNSGSIPTATTNSIGSLPSGTSRFAWPIGGATLTQGFGPTTLWIEPAMFGFPHFHTGLDLASPNTRVTAAADGVVAVVGSGTTGYGNFVIIVHRDGFVTLYGHLTLALVKPGDQVTQGQLIGVEGSTGTSTGTHLHFEVRLNGVPLDPSPYLPRSTSG